ncbi:hypothetical protein HYU13_00930 [Candidatus Woesearchaeota archaeon]|nr:hypothetical protein [Candidatus Woesearchaeota archaeon]
MNREGVEAKKENGSSQEGSLLPSKPAKPESIIVSDAIGVPEQQPQKFRSDLILISGIVLMVLVLALILGLGNFLKDEPKTIDDLHQQNIEGKLDDRRSATFNGFSFIFADGLWYTRVQTSQGNVVFDVPFHYLPDDVNNIPITGRLNASLFDKGEGVFITFDPLGTNLQYVALAIGEFDRTLIKAFGKLPIAACDKNETDACKDRPIITCSSTEKPVLYVRQKEKPSVFFENNCIIVEGQGNGLVKSMERLIYLMYGIVKE